MYKEHMQCTRRICTPSPPCQGERCHYPHYCVCVGGGISWVEFLCCMCSLCARGTSMCDVQRFPSCAVAMIIRHADAAPFIRATDRGGTVDSSLSNGAIE